ncbi:VOC family protein [Blastopirellula sp. JC732]|uniref:VOC family protein n=1 Tax=Blastopirellula sediminis TaxID=2894196 RepID=A0A9X1MIL7_9BACT|nr:VOC family protein [Blastopirellula sediminis]MCC9604315.1 VOC family protein [Blastopirellula sediminis]MCC9626835.1 VOC family protein [Blastopirellula sediminis]
MSSTAVNQGSMVVSCLRYHDASAAIDWLCDVFGFKRHAVYHGEGGTIAHAQLTFSGGGMIMLGSIENESEWGKLIKQPEEIGDCETQSVYLVVADADAIYTKAKAAGAKIVIDIKDEEYGGRDFTCRDLEGRLWTIGTYNPWETSDE